MTRLDSTSALPSARPPASVTGAVPPIIGAGEWIRGRPCSAMNRSLPVAVSECLSGVVGSEYSASVGLRLSSSMPPAAAAAIAAIASQSRDVVADEDDGLFRVAEHERVLQLVWAGRRRVGRDAHGHAEVHLGQRVDEADTVDDVGGLEGPARTRGRIEVVRAVGAGAVVDAVAGEAHGGLPRAAAAERDLGGRLHRAPTRPGRAGTAPGCRR